MKYFTKNYSRRKKISKKRNLIFICLLILGVFLITSCLPKPPVTEGVLKGQVIVPEGSIQAKDLTGQALPDATLNIIDPATGAVIATTVTDANGYYQVFVPAGGPYLLQAVKDGVVILQITPQVEVGIEYDLGTADCSTTAVALIALAMMDAGANLVDVNLADIAADPNFDDVLSNVTSIIEVGGDPTESAAIEQAVEDFLSPPAPAPPPASTPTYTVTYDGNGSTGGTVPSDANNYQQGESVTVLGNTGNLEKTQDGISFLFTGWNTTADGSGTSYDAAATFNMGTANVTLYAEWSAITATGPAGGLIFYDKDSYSDGWRYLETAFSDEDSSIWSNVTNVAVGTSLNIGTGQANTTAIISQSGHTSSAAKLCADLSINNNSTTYDDWFLPSKDELNLMHTNLHKEGFGGFASDYYWSSSEDSANLAWYQYFPNGNQYSANKNYTDRVRAVRAFRSTAPTYIVNYNANEATDGTVPSDSYHYESGETVIVLGNTGTLVKTGYTFTGWNTQADGNGTPRAEGSSFSIVSENVTLYAKWTINTYTVTFDKNGGDTEADPTTKPATHGGNVGTLPIEPTRTGYTFTSWNTEANGSGTEFTASTAVTADITIYAQWTINSYTVTYNGNGNTGGTVPAGPTSYTYGATVTVLGNTGNLVKDGYIFSDWNTWSSGNGTDRAAGSTFVLGASNVTLYAKWTTYSLRDEGPAGGLIFYINPNYATDGWRYLEAAPASTEWSGIWSVNTGLIGANGTAIGTGENNTNEIVTWLDDRFETGRAAQYCFHLSIVNNSETYDDWFLPSIEELHQMRDYLYQWGVGGFQQLGEYWSSSEENVMQARYEYFWNGWQSVYGKNNTLLVRAVRAF